MKHPSAAEALLDRVITYLVEIRRFSTRKEAESWVLRVSDRELLEIASEMMDYLMKPKN